MKPEIKEKWLTALKSGKYIQGTKKLSNHGKHCCLGVLCELAVEAGIISKEVNLEEPIRFGTSCNYLSDEVMSWSGLRNDSGLFAKEDGRCRSLSRINDTECDGKYTSVIPLIERYF